MDCSQSRQLLSSYHDGELVDDLRAQVQQHVGRCEQCAQELDQFRKLSQLVAHLPEPRTPGAVWQGIRDQLDAGSPSPRTQFGWTRRLTQSRLAGLAASLLIAVGISALVFRAAWWPGHYEDHQRVADIDRYIEQFQQDPDRAQQFLVNTYANRLVEPQLVIPEIGYRPVVAAGLPSGYRVTSTYLMTMPCCQCVQSICRREDGSSFAIFEHADPEPMSFGTRRQTRAVCAGKECCLVDLDERIAVSWKRGDRHITLIGAKDRNEIDQMIAWLDQAEARNEESISN